ncbi:DUF1302 domain-containing protein [Solimonas sp. K1W22B-7]|uniref:DUF1302 domain-containing protein n=1 Tax=Solimonas sp. K1W22B-7 TaxID=2303331 RepID=UPI001F0905CF|nr:DUF1302 family protein [Solimonas sp. K1W22B-7]
MAAALLLFSSSAVAFDLSLPRVGDTPLEGVANINITAGVGIRMEDRSSDLVGKGNLNSKICGRRADGKTQFQGCQGLFRTQVFPAEHLVAQPGQFSSNADDGNWNYAKGDLTQAPLKITPDLTLTWGNWGLFARGLFFQDFVNDDFIEYHPNRYTSENLDRVGNISTPGMEVFDLPLPTTTSGVRNDSRPCPADRNPGGGPCGLVFGPGGVVRNKRTDDETLRQIGSDFQLLDLNLFGTVPLWGEHELSVKIGRQTVNWGESTALFFDSINSVNPINANNFFRAGTVLEESFTPAGMAYASVNVAEGLTLEGFYQYEWEGAEAPAPGSFYSTADLGTNNAGDFLALGFGQVPEDPERIARLLDNPLSGLTGTSGAIKREPDRKPPDGGQFGLALKVYADWLNDGTELGLYFTNTHARIPYLSFISAPEGCARDFRDHQGASNTLEFLLACPDIPQLHAAIRPNDPDGATDDATQFDKVRFLLDYPEDIRMFGLSFNTTLGDFSVQGEVAYRPDAPMQVDSEDLAFAAFAPASGLCHLPEANCSGSGQLSLNDLVNLRNALPAGAPQLAAIDQLIQLGSIGVPFNLGVDRNGNQTAYPGSDFVIDAQGTPGSFHDTIDLLVGHAPGGGRLFPSFIVPYRGYTLGKNPANAYVRGWEYFDSYQFNLGGTYVSGASEGLSRAIAADQIVWLFESGATWVPGLPALDQLQLEAPGTFLHASAGADGSGSDRSRQACSTNLACSWGPDGMRFNPHQQDLDMFPDKLSWGYVLIAQVKYESVLPGISLQPVIVWKHDVGGTAPGVAGNFIEGRKIADVLMEIRYKSQLSFNAGYTWITGGGSANLLRDRDQARFFIKYAF